MERWRGKVAVVTGASAGIGEAICEQLVNFGLNVVGLARRKELVEEIARKLQRGTNTGKLYAYKADVSKEEDILEAFRWITENVGPVHILVNNAGIMRPGGLLDGTSDGWKEIFDTNVLGLCVATREAIKIMRAHSIDGHVVHINSISGHTIEYFPNLNVYPASKFAVTALTETLRQELNSVGSKIKITSISPTGVDTKINENGGLVYPPEMMAVKDTLRLLDSKDVADAVCYVLGTPPHVQVHELIIRSLQ
uniref:Dehydrogenase n=1 Tax=Photinus pyralis TaxID=7054 RepID=A0A1Y1LM95_PHOPY